MEIKRLPADEGVRLATKMVKGYYLAEKAGLHINILSLGQTHAIKNGKPYYFSISNIEKISCAINQIAQELLSVRILDNGDVLSQLIELRQKVCLPYIFQDCMGKSESWQRNRVSKKINSRKNGREYTMLGKFTSDEVCQINDAIRVIALTLLSIELVSGNPNNSETPTQSVDIESNAKDKSDHCIAEAISGTLSSAEGEVSHVDIKPSMPNDDFGDADLLLYEEMMLAEMEQGD